MNKHLRLIFPPRPRDFYGKRWLKITLRTLHLLGVAGVSGGILLQVPTASWIGYLHLTVLSGSAYLLLELWSNAILLIQLRGLCVVIKLLLLAILYSKPQYGSLIIVVIILSSVVSHAPGNFRYYSPFHRRRIDAL